MYQPEQSKGEYGLLAAAIYRPALMLLSGTPCGMPMQGLSLVR